MLEVLVQISLILILVVSLDAAVIWADPDFNLRLETGFSQKLEDALREDQVFSQAPPDVVNVCVRIDLSGTSTG